VEVVLPLTLPLTHPVLVFGLAMLIFLCAPPLAERLRVPGMIGIILAGVLVGPHGLQLLERSATMVLLGTVGLLYLMFLAAIEIDLHGMRRHLQRSVVFGALGFALPIGIGTGVAALLGYPFLSAVLMGAVFASHTLVAYPIALRFGISKNPAVTTTLGATVVTDTATLLVLAVVAAAARGHVDWIFWVKLLVPLAAYVAAVALLVPRLAGGFFRRADVRGPHGFLFVMALLFMGSFLAHLAGVEPIIGAFLIGLATNRFLPSGGLLQSRIHFAGEAIFIPFFLLSVGMLVDVRVFLGGGVAAWSVMGSLLAVVLVTKWLAAWVTRWLYGYNRAEGWTMYGLSVSHAAATLAITLVGYELKLFDAVILNAIVLVILVTCIVGPWVVQRYGRQVALEEERRPYGGVPAPQRLLVPMSNPATAQTLLDLALLLRERDCSEPIYALTVVPEELGRADQYVADAEKLLSHAVVYGASAGVHVQALTRVEESFARGIIRAMTETRTRTAVIGWDGRSSRQWIFGSVLDQVLDQSQQQVIVCKLRSPLNTATRVLVAIPQGADRTSCFDEAMQTIKRLASRLGAEVIVHAVLGDPEALLVQLQAVPPATVPIRCESVPSWSRMSALLAQRARPGELVIVLAARRTSVIWHAALARVPAQLARLLPENFLVLYPAETDPAAADELEGDLLGVLTPTRIDPDLRTATLDGAHAHLLELEYGRDRERVHDLQLLLASESIALEIRPGIVISHARVEELSATVVFLGLHASGLYAPETTRPVTALFVVLSPAGQPQRHLELLAQIARLASAPERLLARREAADAAAVWRGLRELLHERSEQGSALDSPREPDPGSVLTRPALPAG
jgi:Kef-type K+ transport system membrane component KefB/mannitol/fructose-specific phosphotransferase system IIA component (Ntr-type)